MQTPVDRNRREERRTRAYVAAEDATYISAPTPSLPHHVFEFSANGRWIESVCWLRTVVKNAPNGSLKFALTRSKSLQCSAITMAI